MSVLIMLTEMNSQDEPVLEGATITAEADGWFTVALPNSPHGHAHLYKAGQNEADTHAVCFVCGDRAVLDTWAEDAAGSWTLASLAADASSVAMDAKRRIPWWRIDGSTSSPFGTQTLENAPAELPTPLPEGTPSVQSPWEHGGYTITALIRPYMGTNIAGHDFPTEAEETV
jgi:hypothetical protein